ncbi:YitT family protein [Halobacillus sp. ACCC02827]|uniref:YczE/YyaS/YitT family protein n=1 Tax=Halobacillus sp. ACCC02827 TaxID=3052090 RepID=UPI00256FCDC1|nr:YitT family protein [Halobacillus sp. ACCC02827]WJE15121.1 YitT family protein [Halobacillus sp. ACCC02827]
MTYLLYVTGIVILALGISLTILSGLGASPFDALLVGLSESIGLTVGSWEIIIAFILIGCNALLVKQRPELFGLLTAMITGISIDTWLFLLDDFLMPVAWYSQATCFLFGLTGIGLGTALYLQSNFAAIPIDRLTLILKEWLRSSITLARSFLYLLFLILAYLFNGPIGIGTLLTVILGGVVLHYFMNRVERMTRRPAGSS